MDLQQQLAALTRPSVGELDGVKISFELDQTITAGATLHQLLENTHLRIYGNTAYTIFLYEDGSAAAYVPNLEDKLRYIGEILGENINVKVRAFTVENGVGLVTLGALDRRSVSVKLLVDENGTQLPFEGKVHLITRDRTNNVRTDMTLDIGEDGLANFDAIEGEHYLFEPEQETLDEGYFDWKITDEYKVPEDGAERVILKRAFNVILESNDGIAGELVTATEMMSGALSAARFDGDSLARLHLEEGTYALDGAEYTYTPDEITVAAGGGTQTIQVTRTPRPFTDEKVPILKVDVELPSDDNRDEGIIYITDPNGVLHTYPVDQNYPIEIADPVPGLYKFLLRGHPNLDGYLEKTIGPEGDAIIIPTGPGPRSRWEIWVDNVVNISLQDTEYITPLLTPYEGEVYVPSIGVARAILVLSNNNLLYAPPQETDSEVYIEFECDVPVTVARSCILVYEDGFAMELVAGRNQVRSGTPDIYYRDIVDHEKFYVLETYCLDGTQNTIILTGGIETTFAELERVLSPLYHSVEVSPPSRRSVTEIEGIGPTTEVALREMLHISNLFDLAQANPEAVPPSGISQERFTSWILQANLLVDLGGWLDPDDVEVLAAAGVTNTEAFFTTYAPQLAFSIQTALTTTQLPADYTPEGILVMRPDLDDYLIID